MHFVIALSLHHLYNVTKS